MTEEIRIQAQPDTNPNRFRFIIDRELAADQTIFADAASAAAGSPLATKLFALEGVVRVEFNGRLTFVTQDGSADWMHLAKAVGSTVREHLQNGEAIVNDGFVPELPPEEQLRIKVQNVVDGEINPAIAMHGGFIEILDVKDKSIYIRMGGGCQGCGMADVTLKQGVERMIREHLPEVEAVLDTTDHASGDNPYYTPGKGE